MPTTYIDITEAHITQITARLPAEMVASLDHVAHALHRSRADIMRQAIEMYLEDFEDLSVSIERLRNPDTAIDQLTENPHVGKLLKGDYSGLRRIRVGAY